MAGEHARGSSTRALAANPVVLLLDEVASALVVPIGALIFRRKGGYFAVGSWLVFEVPVGRQLGLPRSNQAECPRTR